MRFSHCLRRACGPLWALKSAALSSFPVAQGGCIKNPHHYAPLFYDRRYFFGQVNHQANHNEKFLVPYSAEEYFDLVIDIDSYKEFLPCFKESRILRHAKYQDGKFLAELAIGYNMFYETYTSVIECRRPDYIKVVAANSDVFSNLSNTWIFTAGPQLGTTLVTFNINFQFKNFFHQQFTTLFLRQLVNYMANGFRRRAELVYGNRSKAMGSISPSSFPLQSDKSTSHTLIKDLGLSHPQNYIGGSVLKMELGKNHHAATPFLDVPMEPVKIAPSIATGMSENVEYALGSSSLLEGKKELFSPSKVLIPTSVSNLPDPELPIQIWAEILLRLEEMCSRNEICLSEARILRKLARARQVELAIVFITFGQLGSINAEELISNFMEKRVLNLKDETHQSQDKNERMKQLLLLNLRELIEDIINVNPNKNTEGVNKLFPVNVYRLFLDRCRKLFWLS